MDTSEVKIAFIGGGNMAKAMISGLIKSGFKRHHILVCAPSRETLGTIHNEYHVNVSSNNRDAISFADTVILAVKPHLVSEVCEELFDEMQQLCVSTAFVSVAAGISWSALSSFLGNTQRIVCAMPNLPSSVGKGVIGLYANHSTSLSDVSTVDAIMRLLGETIMVMDESLMSAIVAAAGSAPAYFFLFMEAMEKEAIEQGLTPEDAKVAVLQSALGAVSLASRSDASFAELRAQVTSAKGTTESAINTFKDKNLEDAVSQAMRSAAERADEINAQHII
jgi:pyrroline-5-carboxylate reductase